MNVSPLKKSRFIVGIILILVSALIFLIGGENFSVAGGVGFLLLGLASIIASRKR